MEHNLIIQDNQQPSVRNIDTVTQEILSIKTYAQNTAIICAIELGRRFKEAKSMLPHGEWGNWLKEKVDFSQSTVNNYMKIFEEYGSEQISLFGATPLSQSIEKLTYTQAVKLLAIPKEERDEFIEENDVENLSVRELDKLIKERDDAIKKAKEAEQRATELEAYKEQIENSESRIIQAETDRLTAMDELKEAEQKLKDLKDNPKVPQAKVDEIEKAAKEKATQEMQKQIDDFKSQIEKANKEKAEAEAKKKEAEDKLAKMEAQAKMSDSIVTEFKLSFDRLQVELSSCKSIIDKAEKNSPEIAQKLQKAMDALVASLSGEK